MKWYEVQASFERGQRVRRTIWKPGRHWKIERGLGDGRPLAIDVDPGIGRQVGRANVEWSDLLRDDWEVMPDGQGQRQSTG